MTFQRMVAGASLHNVPCELAPAHAGAVAAQDQLGPPVGAPNVPSSRLSRTVSHKRSGNRHKTGISPLWGLNKEQCCLILGNPSCSTLHKRCRKAREHADLTLGVDVHLAPTFDGRPPLDLLS